MAKQTNPIKNTIDTLRDISDAIKRGKADPKNKSKNDKNKNDIINKIPSRIR